MILASNTGCILQLLCHDSVTEIKGPLSFVQMLHTQKTLVILDLEDN